MIRRCTACRYWIEGAPDAPEGYGLCARSNDAEHTLIARDGVDVYTLPTHGCTQFGSRDGTITGDAPRTLHNGTLNLDDLEHQYVWPSYELLQTQAGGVILTLLAELRAQLADDE